MRLRPFSVFIVFVAAAGLVVSMEPSPANAQTTCRYNTDCDDGLFCNGVELCMPSTAGADARGCVRRGNGPCPGVLCLEETKRCAAPDPRCDKTPDRDGDGHRAYECGGTDCDDDDPERYPGRPEVCDAAGHDEDCDPRTVGNKDDDHDGFVDAACKNVVRLIPSTKGLYLAPPSVAATTYVFGASIAHVAHGRPLSAVKSVGLRLGAPVVGALMGFGGFFAWRQLDGSTRESDRVASDGAKAFICLALTVPTSIAAASLLDAAALSWAPPHFGPTLEVARGGATLGVRGAL